MQFAKFLPRYIAACFFACVFSGPLIVSGASGGTPQVVPGVGNFHKVEDHVYRGAQPTDEGFRNLAKLGIQTVIDLRELGERSTAEEKTVKAAGMQYVKIPMKGMEKPSDESIRKALDLLEDKTTGPVFVHCMRGADRTGDVIACYRVEQDHWKNTAALAEARSLGMSWFQKSIQHYVLSYRPRILDTAPSVAAGVAAAAAAPVSAIVHQQ
jgi:protein tyrosine phosphatase (PTP) superfamily phosphohydrolase (DUF442 family)